jgi:hypothetical protein
MTPNFTKQLNGTKFIVMEWRNQYEQCKQKYQRRRFESLFEKHRPNIRLYEGTRRANERYRQRP